MINFDEFDFTYGFSELNHKQKADCLTALKSAVMNAFDALNHNDVMSAYQTNYSFFLDLIHKAKSTLITLCDREAMILITKIHSLEKYQEACLTQHLVELQLCLEDTRSALEDIELMV